MNYQLAPYFKSIPKEEVNPLGVEEIEKVYSGELFVMLDQRSDEILLVNPVIQLFLLAFTFPTSFKEVLQRFAEEAECAPEELVRTLKRFFEDMKYRGVLLSVKAIEKMKARESLLIPYPDNTMIGKYRIVRTMCVDNPIHTYLAEDVENESRKVVIKALRVPHTIPAERLAHWRKEFAHEWTFIRESLSCKAIVQFLEYVETSDTTYGVMEYIEGLSLRKRVEEGESLWLSEKFSLYAQTLEVFAFLHSLQIIHGDIHTSNLLLDSENRIRLIDFDLSQHSGCREGELFRSGGVHEYIAPEKISENVFEIVESRADFASEVYQLGIVGYFIFYERLPFTGSSWETLGKKIKETTPIFKESTPRGEIITDLLRSFLQKSLEHESLKRFSSAEDMFKTWKLLFT